MRTPKLVSSTLRVRWGAGLRSQFAVVLASLLVVLAVLGWAGLSGLSSTRDSLSRIYKHNVRDQSAVVALRSQLDDAEELILRGWVNPGAAPRARLASELESSVLPDVDRRIIVVTQFTVDGRAEAAAAHDIATRWSKFKLEWEQGKWRSTASAAVRLPYINGVVRELDALDADANRLVSLQNAESAKRYEHGLASERSSRHLMFAALVLGLLLSLAIGIWLTRSVLMRILRLSRCAGRIASGDYSARIDPRGRDEIDRLGRILDDVADGRARAEEYDRTQNEFSDFLQMTQNEQEADDLLGRHLARTLPDATVTVLKKNNSENALQPVTPIAQESPLASALIEAIPGDCLAVRSAAPHSEASDDGALVRCKLCAATPGMSLCTPLLVGGEVIGSIHVKHKSPLEHDSKRRIRESVRLAAPVLANLRNLAVAQIRASIDGLTGLPNRRTMDDALKRMVAQAQRSGLPLVAMMIDLDHFKKVNDLLGHAAGDDLLAAVGALLSHLLRASDFAGRYGGEEFLLLLPNTDQQGAVVVAEKIRRAISDLELGDEASLLTASIGVAVLPDNATSAAELLRAADRALYVAKTNGRDRIEMASGAEPVAALELPA